MTELVWDGKYKDGKKQGPVRIALPFQTIETVNESAQDRRRTLELFASGRDSEWRNRLIWGDRKYVLPSLLPEFAGKVNLIYIDPPFDTGSDFSFTATIPGAPEVDGEDSFTFTKEASIIEHKAYRDTWGRGLESYLQWFYDTATFLHELLHETGTIYVHLDWHVSFYAKAILDEIFGSERFVNEIIWKRQTAKGDVTQGAMHMGRLHESIFVYTKSANYTWNMQYVPYDEKYLETHYRTIEPGTNRRIELDNLTAPGGAAKGNPNYEFLGVKRFWRYKRERMDELYKAGRIVQPSPGAVPRYKRYLDEMPGLPLQDIWTDINAINSQAIEAAGYATQKPEALLNRILKLSSNANDLVFDCFVGSGTTAVVAEKLKRRWVCCDLGRFGIHTSRKRLLAIPRVTPFVVQNLGKYERQAWQVAEFPGNGKNHLEEQRQREGAYREFILELYHARPTTGHAWLHGMKSGRMVHVREFFEQKAFGHPADLSEPAVVKAMSTPVAHYVCVDVFKKALQALTIEEQTPQLLEPARLLSTCQPFPWSRPVWEGQKCIFNLVPCDNDFEREFAKFLDNAKDVTAFAKLPRAFGFTIEYTDTSMNLRNYEPDFVAIDKSGVHWLLESKGQENVDVLRKDVAAVRWCQNASKLTDKQWKYAKVPQKEFEVLQPRRLADLAALMPSLFDEAEG